MRINGLPSTTDGYTRLSCQCKWFLMSLRRMIGGKGIEMRAAYTLRQCMGVMVVSALHPFTLLHDNSIKFRLCTPLALSLLVMLRVYSFFPAGCL